jgi:hypothetical protein
LGYRRSDVDWQLAREDADVKLLPGESAWGCTAVRLQVRRDRMNSTNDADEESESDRRLANIVLAVAFVLLVGAGIWLASAMIDARKADECIASGRRNCNPIEVAPR